VRDIGSELTKATTLLGEQVHKQVELERRIERALEIAGKTVSTDMDRADWIIDQMARALTGDAYDEFVARACRGPDGSDHFLWTTGKAP
jgi:hypothetical protein